MRIRKGINSQGESENRSDVLSLESIADLGTEEVSGAMPDSTKPGRSSVAMGRVI